MLGLLFGFAVGALTIFNILRMALTMIGADIYDLKKHRSEKNRKIDTDAALMPGVSGTNTPLVSVIIPAYNEEAVILRCLKSVLKSDYSRYRVIVVDDGSKDTTKDLVTMYLRTNKNNLNVPVKLVSQPNAGKGHALNSAIDKHVKEGIVLVLDSDSTIAPNAISRGVAYLNDHPEVVAASSNIKVMPDSRIVGLIQEFEYVISNRMRKGFNMMNSEYVVGGVGSYFRLETLKAAGYYSSDTITEDLDLTFKIIQLGNKENQIGYIADSHAFTEGVMTIRELIKQRMRWKYGRYQAYKKHRNLFFSSSDIIDKRFSKLVLPYTVIMDFVFLFEPVIISIAIGIALYLGGPVIFAQTYLVITFYVALHILMDNTINWRRKATLLILAPYAYFLLAVAAFVEYTVLIKLLGKLPTIFSKKIKHEGRWEHVQRSGQQMA